MSWRKVGWILFWFGLQVSPMVIDRLSAQTTLHFSGTPEDSWQYRRLYNAGPPVCTYFPRETSEYEGVEFQGYVTYSRERVGGVFGAIYTDPPPAFHIFTTYVLSERDVTIPIRINGDDGHSLFVDDQFLGGGGFGVEVDLDVSFKAEVPTKVELAGHDSCPQGWVFALFVRDKRRSPINDIPGIQLNAEGDFSGAFDWPQYGLNNLNTRFNPYETVLNPSNVSQLQMSWRTGFSCSIYTTPAVADGKVYAGTYCGDFYAFDANTGRTLWQRAINGAVAHPTVADGVVYIGARNQGTLYAFADSKTPRQPLPLLSHLRLCSEDGRLL